MGLQQEFDYVDSTLIEWDPFVFDGVTGYGIYVTEVDLSLLPRAQVAGIRREDLAEQHASIGPELREHARAEAALDLCVATRILVEEVQRLERRREVARLAGLEAIAGLLGRGRISR